MSDYVQRYTDEEEQKYARQIRRIYGQAAKEVKAKLSDFTQKHNAKSAELLRKVSSGEITMDDYQAWLRGQVFQERQWKQKLSDITSVYMEADKKARKILNETTSRVFTESANYAAYDIEKRTGGAVSFSLYDQVTVKRLTKDDPKLLPEWKIDQPKDYTWNYGRVQNAVTQGIIQGESISSIGKRLTNELAASNAHKMGMFARTAVTGAQSAGRIERLHETQDMGITVKKKWLSAHDSRVRDDHAAFDGVEKDVDEPFVTDDGREIMYPGDPTAPPELVYNCRCTLTYVYPKYQKRGKPDESFDEWQEDKQAQAREDEQQSTEEQREQQVRWRSREEYEQAKAERDEVLQREQTEAMRWFDSERDKLIESYGGPFIKQRIAIKQNATLSNSEKEERLSLLREAEDRYKQEKEKLGQERDRRWQAAFDRHDSVFDPHYEYGRISGAPTIQQNAAAINPNWTISSFEYTHNCQRCALAFEFRERGFDVEAGARMSEADVQPALVYMRVFPGCETYERAGFGHENTVAVRNQMEKWGDGARAIVTIDRENGQAGHAFNAEFRDGHLILIDSQLGGAWSDANGIDSFDGGALEEAGTFRLTLYRTDNIDTNSLLGGAIPDGWLLRRQKR